MNVVSGVYPTSVSKAGTANQRNQEKADKFDAREAEEQSQAVYNAGSEEGFRAGYSDFEQRLAASQQYTPIVEGSPEDVMMQQNVTDGINYQEEQEPSFLDMISDKISNSKMWNSEEQTGAANFDDPNQELRLKEEAEYNRQLEQQEQKAGLAELKQTLNNREY
jgi:hypothetical protein